MFSEMFKRHFCRSQEISEKHLRPFFNAIFHALSESVFIFFLSCLEVEKSHKRPLNWSGGHFDSPNSQPIFYVFFRYLYLSSIPISKFRRGLKWARPLKKVLLFWIFFLHSKSKWTIYIFCMIFRCNARPLNSGLEKIALHIWIQNDLSFPKLFEIWRLEYFWQDTLSKREH